LTLDGGNRCNRPVKDTRRSSKLKETSYRSNWSHIDPWTTTDATPNLLEFVTCHVPSTQGRQQQR